MKTYLLERKAYYQPNVSINQETVELRVELFGTDTYFQCVLLRERTLLLPFGKHFSGTMLENEKEAIHVALWDSKQPIGCAVLVSESDKELVIKQIAWESYVNEGLKLSLVKICEKIARSLGYEKLYMRLLSFQEISLGELGWVPTGKTKIEQGLLFFEYMLNL